MKKILALLLSFLFCLAFAPPPAVSAASASASLSGPSTVRAGDTITVTFRVNASGVTGFTGEVRYDASQLTLTGAQQKIGNPWMVEFNNTAGVVKFVAYDNALTSPINGTADLFAMTFKVSNVAAGTAVSLSSSGVIASDGAADVNVGNAGYSVTIAEPLSGNTFLSGLTIENAALSPAFNKNTTSYQVQVPYSVSRLSIKATAEDAKSKVTINQPNLTPGGTTKVTITVQAQTGATKAYSISVARAQDPNYKPSGNNDLSSLAVDGFLLSPPFSPDIKSYVVWLPYETESVEISGAAADAKATVQTNGGETLLAGQDNPVTVTCSAENGDKQEYLVIVKRAAAHDGSVESLPEESSEPESSEAPSEPESSKPVSSEEEISSEIVEASSGSPLWLTIMLCFVCLAAGFGVAVVIQRNHPNFLSSKKRGFKR